MKKNCTCAFFNSINQGTMKKTLKKKLTQKDDIRPETFLF